MTLHCLTYKDCFFTLDRNAVQTVWYIVQCSVTNVHGFLVFLLAAFRGKLHLFQVPFQLKSFVMTSLTPSSVMPSGQTPRSYCASRMSVSTSGMTLAQVVSRTLPSAQPPSFLLKSPSLVVNESFAPKSP